MPVDRTTIGEVLSQLRQLLLEYTSRYDTGYGPIKDLYFPVAGVVQSIVNDTLRPVSLLVSVEDVSEIADEDLDRMVFNEGILRPQGGQSTVTMTAQRSTPPAVGETVGVARGHPISTSQDSVTGAVVTFVATETVEASGPSGLPFSAETGFYELEFPAICLARGTAGVVGPNRINKPLRPLVGFSRVTNKTASSTVADRFDNEQLKELYLLATSSRQIAARTGIEFYLRDTFSSILDAYEVPSTDPILTRGEAGAVDVYIKGDSSLSDTTVGTYFGVGQVIPIELSPMIEVTEVTSGANTYIKDTDFEEVFDISGYASSVRAVDGIRFLSIATTALPSAGDNVSIVYTYDNLVRLAQTDVEQDGVAVEGQDRLIKSATEVPIVLNANLKVRGGANPTAVASLVAARIVEAVNSLGIGDDVEVSDLQKEARSIATVDNFVVTRLTRETVSEGDEDLVIGSNEYASLVTTSIVLTIV